MRLSLLTSLALLLACSTAEQTETPAAKGTKADATASGAQSPTAATRELPEDGGPQHGDPQGMSHQGPIAFAAAPIDAKVSFVEPADGATVSSPVHLVFHVDGMNVAPAGAVMHGQGHHHVIVDRESFPAAEGIPVGEEGIYHFGKGQLETDLELSPGSHTLTLQFADGIHRSFGPELSTSIRVTVEGEVAGDEAEAAAAPSEPVGEAATPAGTPE